jgi:hypothetical protein
MRVKSVGAVSVLATALFAECDAPRLPENVTFDDVALTRVASWSQENMSGSVYVRAGQTLPKAPMQIGVIVSHQHVTATELHRWIREQALRAGPQWHNSGTADESCTVGRTSDRIYMALEVCKTGVERAACVEADEELDEPTFGSCVSGTCFEDVCDARWLVRRAALDELAADILSKR